MRPPALFAALAALCLPTPSPADQADDLMAALAAVPDAAAVRRASPIFSYLDIRRLEEASGPGVSVVALDDTRPLFRAQSGPGDVLPYWWLIVEGLPATWGVPAGAIDRALGFGVPPATGTILAGDDDLTDAAAIAATATGRGFAERAVEGVTVWHRLEDNEFDIQNRDPADPFGGSLGRAARVAVLPGMLAGSSTWALTTAMVEAATDSRRSLADDVVLAAAVKAVAAEGILVQAQLWAARDVGAYLTDPAVLFQPTAPPQTEPTAPPQRNWQPLPAYPFALFADRQQGAMEAGVIALPYLTRSQAEAAAAELGRRLESAPAPDGRGGRLVDWLTVTPSTGVHVSEDGRFFVTMVLLAGTTPDSVEGDPLPPTAGRAFRYLIQAIQRRDLRLLTIEP